MCSIEVNYDIVSEEIIHLYTIRFVNRCKMSDKSHVQKVRCSQCHILSLTFETCKCVLNILMLKHLSCQSSRKFANNYLFYILTL